MQSSLSQLERVKREERGKKQRPSAEVGEEAGAKGTARLVGPAELIRGVVFLQGKKGERKVRQRNLS